jgi:hypothetical protein
MKKMKLELYKEVALREDVPEHGLKRGDVATLVDFAPVKGSKERGAVLEVFDAVGNTIAVVIVPDTQVEPLHAGEVLSVRNFAAAS